jgi:hypothetical protein
LPPKCFEHRFDSGFACDGWSFEVVSPLFKPTRGDFRRFEFFIGEGCAIACAWLKSGSPQHFENLRRWQFHSRIDEDSGKGAYESRRGDTLAKSSHPGSAMMKADRDIGTDCCRPPGECFNLCLAAIGFQEKPDRRGGIGRSAAKAGGNGKVLSQPEIPMYWAAEPAFDSVLRLQNEIIAIQSFREWTLKSQAVGRSRFEAQRIAIICEGDQAFELMIAIGSLSEDMKCEIDLRVRGFAQRRRRLNLEVRRGHYRETRPMNLKPDAA